MPFGAKMGDLVTGTDTHIVLVPSPGGPVPTPTPLPFTGTITGGCSADVMIDGKPAGEVTSGNFSPMLGHGIALAFVPPDADIGAHVVIEGREPLQGQIVKPPFVTPN